MAKILKGDGKAIMGIFIGAIIALTLIAVIANSTYASTTTLAQTNATVTAPAVNATLDLSGRTLIATTSIVNATNPATSTNGITLQTGTSSTTGLRTVQVTLNDTAAAFAGKSINVSYTYQPDGYLPDGASRSITALVVLFGALGILIFVVVVLYKAGSLGDMIRRYN